MKTYAIYLKNIPSSPLEKAIFVKEGFSLWAAIFGAFWMVYNRMWLCSVLLIAANVGLVFLEKQGFAGAELSTILQTGLMFFIGFNANDFYAKSLEMKGYKLFSVVTEKNICAAQQRFFDKVLTG